ncbi:CBS domain-containing protein [Cohaesibacter celericrescens]|uniref:CBS domain-containing protein n=1 Tax=Cohaesibacter celericrescens TaxID=2067669 RepID=UPI0035621060
MPCIDAMIDKVVSLTPDQTVEEAMKILDEKRIRTAPVLDENDIMLGLFGYERLLQQMLPISVTMPEGLERLSFLRGAKPDIARRLRAIKSKPVELVMNRTPKVLSPNMSVWEGIRKLAKHGSPLPVLDPVTNKFLGIVTEQSAIAELERDEYGPK